MADHHSGFSNDISDRPWLSAPWTRETYPSIAQWIDANHSALEQIIKSSHLAFFSIPKVTTAPLWFSSIPQLERIDELVHLFAARMMLAVGSGQLDSALDDLLALHRLAKLLVLSGERLTCSSGLAIYEIALACAEEVLKYADEDQIVRYQVGLNAASLPDDVLVGILDHSVRIEALDLLQRLAVDKELRGDLFGMSRFTRPDPNVAFNVCQAEFDRLVTSLQQTNAFTRSIRLDEYLESHRERSRKLGRCLWLPRRLLWTSRRKRSEALTHQALVAVWSALPEIQVSLDRVSTKCNVVKAAVQNAMKQS